MKLHVNIHKEECVVDNNLQVDINSIMETVFCVTRSNINVPFSNNNGVITLDSLQEGDNVTVWMWCTRLSETGGICERKVVQADETVLNSVLNPG